MNEKLSCNFPEGPFLLSISLPNCDSYKILLANWFTACEQWKKIPFSNLIANQKFKFRDYAKDYYEKP